MVWVVSINPSTSLSSSSSLVITAAFFDALLFRPLALGADRHIIIEHLAEANKTISVGAYLCLLTLHCPAFFRKPVGVPTVSKSSELQPLPVPKPGPYVLYYNVEKLSDSLNKS